VCECDLSVSVGGKTAKESGRERQDNRQSVLREKQVQTDGHNHNNKIRKEGEWTLSGILISGYSRRPSLKEADPKTLMKKKTSRF
jgi:hypothetical protein